MLGFNLTNSLQKLCESIWSGNVGATLGLTLSFWKVEAIQFIKSSISGLEQVPRAAVKRGH